MVRQLVVLVTGVLALIVVAMPTFANQDVSARQAYEMLQADKSIVVLDIRTPDEFRAGHIENAINVDF